MTKTTLLAPIILLALGGTTAGAAPINLPQSRPAAAERLLPPYEIETILQSMNLDVLTRPIRRGVNYVVRALDRYGNEVRVVVDARVGEVVALRPVRRPARTVVYAPPPPGWRWRGRYVPEWGEVPPPPAIVPSPARPEPQLKARLEPETGGPRVIYAPDSPHRPQAGIASQPTLPLDPPLPRIRPSAASLQPGPAAKLESNVPLAAGVSATPLSAVKPQAAKPADPPVNPLF